MKVKEESEKVGLKLNIQKMKIMASGPITSWEIDGGQRGSDLPRYDFRKPNYHLQKVRGPGLLASEGIPGTQAGTKGRTK